MDIQAFRGVREGPIGWRIVAVAIISVVTVTVLTALAVALAPPRPPGSDLVGTTWRWTGATTGSPGVPVVVPEPSPYTIDFMPDSTFRAAADCITVSGTYTRGQTISGTYVGSAGPAAADLGLAPDPYRPASCGPDTLSDVFLQGLWSAARYVVADSELLVLRSDRGTMTFVIAGRPAADAPVGR